SAAPASVELLPVRESLEELVLRSSLSFEELLFECAFNPFAESESTMELPVESTGLEFVWSLWESLSLEFSESCPAFLPEFPLESSLAMDSVVILSPSEEVTSPDDWSSMIFDDLSLRMLWSELPGPASEGSLFPAW